jgi:type II secretory pathway component HofQ
VTLDFKDGSLQDVFRLFADITGLNVVVHPGIGGIITFGAKDMPWDEALDRILAPHGLVAIQLGNILEIAPPERLVGAKTFTGTPTDFEFKDTPLDETFRRVAAVGNAEATLLPPAAGRVTIVLKQVPWDQALDLIARVNGLAWKQKGAQIRVGRAVDLR